MYWAADRIEKSSRGSGFPLNVKPAQLEPAQRMQSSMADRKIVL